MWPLRKHFIFFATSLTHIDMFLRQNATKTRTNGVSFYFLYANVKKDRPKSNLSNLKI